MGGSLQHCPSHGDRPGNRVRGRTMQQRPLATKAETVEAEEHMEVVQEPFTRNIPSPITSSLLPSFSTIRFFLRLSSLPVSSLKRSLTASNPLWSPKRGINCAFYSFRICQILAYITSFSCISILSDLLQHNSSFSKYKLRPCRVIETPQ